MGRTLSFSYAQVVIQRRILYIFTKIEKDVIIKKYRYRMARYMYGTLYGPQWCDRGGRNWGQNECRISYTCPRITHKAHIFWGQNHENLVHPGKELRPPRMRWTPLKTNWHFDRSTRKSKLNFWSMKPNFRSLKAHIARKIDEFKSKKSNSRNEYRMSLTYSISGFRLLWNSKAIEIAPYVVPSSGNSNN